MPQTRVRLVACCAAILLAGPLLAPTASADDLRDRQHKVRGQIKSAQSDLHDSSKALAAATRKLQRSRAALAKAQGKLAGAQQRLDAAEAYDAKMQLRLQAAEHALAVARDELEKARAEVKEQRRRIGELAASNYVHGDPALMGLKVILKSQDPAEVTSQMNTVDSLMNRQDRELEQLRKVRAAVLEKKERVAAAKEEVAKERRAAAENVVRTRVLRQRAAEARAEVADKVAKNRDAEAVATRARRADLVQLRALKKQEDRIKRQILERARKQRGGFKGRTGGFLERPVPGIVTSSYGYRRHPIYGYWGLHDGTDFRAPCGTSMRAVSSGTVISRYWSDVYGNRLYLDLGKVNGRNLTVVYNHASSYRVGVGERVSRGETVGWAGNTGWSTACHLHFTVLRNGSPVNPMNYM